VKFGKLEEYGENGGEKKRGKYEAFFGRL